MVCCEATLCLLFLLHLKQNTPFICVGSRAHLQDDAVANVSVSAITRHHIQCCNI